MWDHHLLTCWFYSLFQTLSVAIGCSSHRNRVCEEKRKLYWEQVIFFHQSLSLPPTLTCSLSLAHSFAESQAVCGAINIINQHNSTALSSAGRDEEARGNVNMLAWSSPNQWYISHITRMRAGTRKERQSGNGETDKREIDNCAMGVCFLGTGGRQWAREWGENEVER